MSRPDFLRGIRIVDLSMGWAGPLATRHLADLGADVIKVESCVRFDWFRGWESSQAWIDNNEAEKHPPFLAMNRNKRAVTLDLANDRGRDLLLQLVAVSDAVVENFAGSVLPKLGLGYEQFRAVKDNIVMISMPGFGSTGPWKSYRAYGSTTEQAAGLPHLSGRPEWPPAMVHIALGDAVAGLNGCAAVLTAVRHLKRTGQGQFLDLSHSECLFPFGVHGMVEQALLGTSPPRLGNKSRFMAPHGAYACRDGEWIVIQVQDEHQWDGMCRAVGASLREFGDLEDRLERNASLDVAVTAWTRRYSADEAMLALQAEGVAAAAVRDSKDMHSDPHNCERNVWRVLERAYVGSLPHVVAPYRLGAEPLGIASPSPTLGQHNREILGGILGLSDDDLADLERAGVIGTKPRLPEGKR